EQRRRLLEGRSVQSRYESATQQYQSAMPAQHAEYKFDMRQNVAYFTRSPLKDIEKAANKANEKLVNSFEKKTEEIFAEAYAKYKANSESYYVKYKKSLYDK